MSKIPKPEPMKMPFGKYKGCSVEELPISYCQWLRDNSIDKALGKTFFKAIGSRIWDNKNLKKVL
jgi:hypothetical protein